MDFGENANAFLSKEAAAAFCDAGINLVGTDVGNFLLDDANTNTKIMMLGKLKENEYNGRVSVQFVLEDIAM